MSVGMRQLCYKRQWGKNQIFWLHNKLLTWSRVEKGKNVLEWHKFRWLIGAGLKIKKEKWRQALDDLENLGILEKKRKYAVILPLKTDGEN